MRMSILARTVAAAPRRLSQTVRSPSPTPCPRLPTACSPLLRSWKCAALALLCCTAGCSSFLSAGSAEIAGVAGATLASSVTTDAAVAAGIGLGAQAVGRSVLLYAQRKVHHAAQDRIADAAGGLDVGEVADWWTEHQAPLENDERGRVTVSRIISASGLHCKEIVFSVDAVVEEIARSGFYVAAVCRDGAKWRWASAEPATERWGSLQ